MMNPSGTKFSGDKIVPQSDFRAVTASDRTSKKEVNRIARWNVRALGVCGKLKNIKIEIQRLNIDIFGMNEIKRKMETFGATVTELSNRETKTVMQECKLALTASLH
jgi:hypothetical protein